VSNNRRAAIVHRLSPLVDGRLDQADYYSERPNAFAVEKLDVGGNEGGEAEENSKGFHPIKSEREL
jgi:hypothetical protein